MIKNDDSDAFTLRHSFQCDKDMKLYYKQLFETVVKYQAVRMCHKLRKYQYFPEWMEEEKDRRTGEQLGCVRTARCAINNMWMSTIYHSKKNSIY